MLGPHLVVVPLSTLSNWAREFAAWAPDMNVVTLIGNPEARKVIKDHELYIHADQGTTFRDRRASAQVTSHESQKLHNNYCWQSKHNSEASWTVPAAIQNILCILCQLGKMERVGIAKQGRLIQLS